QEELDSRRPAPYLLPEETLAYARVDDTNRLKEAFQDSSLGRMMSDEKLRPFVGDVYSTLAELFDQISSEVGVSLDELLSIPQGEIAFAVVALDPEQSESRVADNSTSDGGDEETEKPVQDDSPEAIRRRIAARRLQRNQIGGAVILETGKNDDLLRKILDRLEERLTESRFVKSEERIDKTDVVMLYPAGEGRLPIAYFQRDGVTVIGVGQDVAVDILARMSGTLPTDAATLAQNRDFTAVMSHSVGMEATRPQVTFYVHPYEIAQRLVRRNPGVAGMALSILDQLGLKKLRGIGGSSFSGGETFESIGHLHVLIDTPRDGIFGLVRPENGPTAPPKWVPQGVSSYTTWHWDYENTYKNTVRLIERFAGSGFVERRAVEPVMTRTGINLPEDVINQMGGRATLVRWLETSATFNGQAQLIGIEFKDPQQIATVLGKAADTFGERVNQERLGDYTIYKFGRDNQAALSDNASIRRPTPCAALVRNTVMVSDSQKLLEKCIQAQSGTISRLQTLPEFDLLAGEVGAQVTDEQLFMFSFLRADLFIRQFYDMASAPTTRQMLQQGVERNQDNQFLGKMNDLLNKHDLPSFEEFSKYFAPSGEIAYDTPTGIHYSSYTLRPID
ncbi:MAG: hypothetical protein AAFN70_08635, partial [Planctomycetota bacterium]